MVGRPRTFDIDRALNIAADMFWRRGYDCTSITELTAAIGISAPSFYFAFGSKEAVFQRILAAYLERQSVVVEAAFAETDARELTRALLTGFSDFLTDPDHAPGCLILNDALPITEEHPFRAEWAAGRQALRERLATRFRNDQSAGRGFPPGWDPEHMARLVASLIWGLAIEVHSGADAKAIHAMIRQFMATWPCAAAGGDETAMMPS